MPRCPVCEKGMLHPGKIKESVNGINLGEYDGETCSHCGETFLGSDEMKRLEDRAKANGIFGWKKGSPVSSKT